MRRIGVLWSGDHLFEGTVETLELLRSRGISPSPDSDVKSRTSLLTIHAGKRIVFVTNNSTKSRSDYKTKLTDMGIPATVVRLCLLSLIYPEITPLRTKSLAPPTVPQFTSHASWNSLQTREPSTSSAKEASKLNLTARVFLT